MVLRETNLSEDKKYNIIYASIDEFSEKGYSKASTNTIMKNAGVSKGLIFHYFGNKKNLYIYIVQYTCDRMSQFLSLNTLKGKYDVFELITDILVRKVQIAYEHPKMYMLIFDAFYNTPDEVKEEFSNKAANLKNSTITMLKDKIDTSKFREDIEYEKAVHLIYVFIEAMTSKHIDAFRSRPDKGLSQIDMLLEELKSYIDILKKGAYESKSW